LKVNKAVFDKIGLGAFNAKLEQFQVFPNPSNDKVYLKFNSKSTFGKESEISIYTIYGKNVLQFNYNETGLDVSNLSSGVYYIQYEQQIIPFIKK
jgi:hypothetical protein